MRNHSTAKKQRIRLFKRGNDRCPICLTAFTEQDVEHGSTVNLEHVPAEVLVQESSIRDDSDPPRAVAMCLTCKPCNSRTGRVEQAVADAIHAERREVKKSR